MRPLSGKLTYSNVMVTVLALVVLGGGTAYAATEMLPKDSVGTRQIQKEAVTPSKLSKSARSTLTGPSGATGAVGAAGPRGEQGGRGERGEPGAQGPPATSLFAQVDSNGTVNASGSPVTVDHYTNGTYILDFGRNVTHCAAIADQGAVPVFSDPGSDTGSSIGDGPTVAITSPASPEEEYAPGFPLADSIAVTTWHGSSPSDTSFYIAVFC